MEPGDKERREFESRQKDYSRFAARLVPSSTDGNADITGMEGENGQMIVDGEVFTSVAEAFLALARKLLPQNPREFKYFKWNYSKQSDPLLVGAPGIKFLIPGMKLG
jgi:hypothetical protein